MAINSRTYNVLIDRLQAFATGHYILQKFTHGQVDEIDINKDNVYPWMHVVPVTIAPGAGVLAYTFDVYFSDIPRDKTEEANNQREIISDMVQIALDLISEIKNGQVLFGSDVSVNENPIIEPFIREFTNTLSGCKLTLDIIVPYLWDACDIPADFSVGGEGAGSSGSASGLILRVNGTDNAVQNILDLVQGSNITITDLGDGRVRITATGGAGGGVETVTGLNTDNTDPNNPIVRVSVDGTSITGAGTPGSPLVATAEGIPPGGTKWMVLRKASNTSYDVEWSFVSIAEISGFTTVGSNIAALANPSAVTYLRINADNSVSTLSAAAFLSAIGGQAAGTYLVASNNLSDLVSAATARTNLGLGTLATQNGTFSGTSSGTNTGDQDLSGLMVKSANLSDVANAATSRTNLGATTVGAGIFTVANPSAIRYIQINADNSITLLSAAQAQTAITGLTRAVATGDTSDNSTNVLKDFTGVGVSVVAGSIYHFRAVCHYESSSTAIGSRWTVNGPAVTFISYSSRYALTATTQTVNHGLNAYQLPAANNATSAATSGNLAVIEGIIQPSANGTLQVQFACESNLGTITAKTGSFIEITLIS